MAVASRFLVSRIHRLSLSAHILTLRFQIIQHVAHQYGGGKVSLVFASSVREATHGFA